MKPSPSRVMVTNASSGGRGQTWIMMSPISWPLPWPYFPKAKDEEKHPRLTSLLTPFRSSTEKKVKHLSPDPGATSPIFFVQKDFRFSAIYVPRNPSLFGRKPATKESCILLFPQLVKCPHCHSQLCLLIKIELPERCRYGEENTHIYTTVSMCAYVW